MHQFNSRIAAASATRHVELLDDLDRLGESIGKTVASFSVSTAEQIPEHERYAYIVRLIHRHYDQIFQRLFKLFDQLAVKQHLAAVTNIATHLPMQVIKTFAEITGPLMEDLGQVVIALQTAKPHIIDRTKRLREPAYKRLPETEQRRIFRELLLPRLEKQVVQRIIFGSDPQAMLHRIGQETALADPMRIANIVTQGMAQGKNRVEISRELKPLLQGNRSSAMRVARTEGARVANQANMLAFDELGEMVVGFQTHAVLDERTRPWHAVRNGQICYKKPKQEQKGLFQLPHPPEEPDDPNERPAGTPKLARY